MQLKDDKVWFDLLLKANELRASQRAYMADRGNQSKGQAVGRAATKLDEAIEEVEKTL